MLVINAYHTLSDNIFCTKSNKKSKFTKFSNSKNNNASNIRDNVRKPYRESPYDAEAKFDVDTMFICVPDISLLCYFICI